jgi:phospholipase/carboxylesterase
MSYSTTESAECVILDPAEPATAAVIWLHGLGADGHDFEPIVPQLHLTRTRFVFPHAPAMPVTINGGWVMPSWYDIRSMGRGPGRENEEHIRASATRIGALIEDQIAAGVPADHIVLAGFSQGAAMALHVGLRYPSRLGGILALSGYLVVEETLEAEASPANAATPVFVGHGDIDDVVPVDAGRRAWERVRAGRDARWSTWRMGHEVCGPEIDAVARWLGAVIPPGR